MSCASTTARDSAMPNVGHAQTNSSGPAGGSGHAHQRVMNGSGPPPPANGYRTGPAGAASCSGLLPPLLQATWVPSEYCSPTGTKPGPRPGHAARRAGAPPGWLALGRIRAVREISIPAENTDIPVSATTTWSDRPSSRVADTGEAGKFRLRADPRDDAAAAGPAQGPERCRRTRARTRSSGGPRCTVRRCPPCGPGCRLSCRG